MTEQLSTLTAGVSTHVSPDNSAHLIKVDGITLLLFHCVLCGREFAREPDQSEWRAAHVGPFRVKFMPDAVNERWVSEPCPGSSEAIPNTAEKSVVPEGPQSPLFSKSPNELVPLPAPPAAPRRRRTNDQPAELVESTPTIAPPEGTVKAQINRGGRPSKARFLPTFDK
jgi:hypothetical protein